MRTDANRLMTLCLAIEEASNAGLAPFAVEDLLTAKQELEALRMDVDRALLAIEQLTATGILARRA